jgi:cbb3-type cytochrome oxidase subunit 1
MHQYNTGILVQLCSKGLLFIISRNWKQLRWPSNEEWIKKVWVIYKIKKISAIKSKKNHEICKQIDGT